jgi:hypothetical protein
MVLDQTREGYYNMVPSRKYVDGKLHTFQSKEEHQTELMQLKTLRDMQIAELVKFLTSLEGNRKEVAYPEEYKGMDHHGAAVIRIQGSEEDTLPKTHGSLKETLAYSNPSCDKTSAYLAPPRPPSPPPNPQGLGAMECMVGVLTDTLKDLRKDMNNIKSQVLTGDRYQPHQSDPPWMSSGRGGHPVSSEAEPTRLEPNPTMEPAYWWYAVGKGKNGVSGVFPSWAEASKFVLGILGAVIKKFQEYDKAV